MKFRTLPLYFFAILAPLAAFAVNKDQINKMMDDLDIIKNTFEVKYAPAEWKKSYANWDLNEQINLAKRNIKKNPKITVKDYQHILKQFFNSTRDYHVGVQFFSTELALLPFGIQSAEGKYFFTWTMSPNPDDYDFDMEQLTEEEQELLSLYQFPFCAGDEIVEFDGKPIDKVIQEIKKNDFGNFESETDQALAESAFSMRLGSKGQYIPQGPVKIVAKKSDTGELVSFTTKWIYIPELIQNQAVHAIQKNVVKDSTSSKRKPLSQNPYFSKQRHIPLFDNYKSAYASLNKKYSHLFPLKKIRQSDEDSESSDDDDGFMVLESKKGPLPNLGKVIWEAPRDYEFRAYMFEQKNGHVIGYIRIPTFMAGTDEARRFEKLILWFEEQTDALVIDQLNNPGGLDLYMYSLASMLTDQPLDLPTEQITLTQEDVYLAHEFLEEVNDFDDDDLEEFFNEEIYGYELTPAFLTGLVDHFNFVISEWNAGRCFTNQTHMYGMKQLQPHSKARYTKPILILVNGLDFSCGDFFPALMQDNQRATIFGSQTAGAGGFVLSGEYYNRFGVAFYHFTGSIAQRLNKMPIENLGITPDIPYQLTERDLKEKYPDYVNAVNNALNKILPVQTKPLKR